MTKYSLLQRTNKFKFLQQRGRNDLNLIPSYISSNHFQQTRETISTSLVKWHHFIFFSKSCCPTPYFFSLIFTIFRAYHHCVLVEMRRYELEWGSQKIVMAYKSLVSDVRPEAAGSSSQKKQETDSFARVHIGGWSTRELGFQHGFCSSILITAPLHM